MSPPPPQHPLRAEPRVVAKVQLPVSTLAWDGYLPLWTKDVSAGGAFFLYSERLVPSSGMRCTVRLGSGLDAQCQIFSNRHCCGSAQAGPATGCAPGGTAHELRGAAF